MLVFPKTKCGAIFCSSLYIVLVVLSFQYFKVKHVDHSSGSLALDPRYQFLNYLAVLPLFACGEVLYKIENNQLLWGMSHS